MKLASIRQRPRLLAVLGLLLAGAALAACDTRSLLRFTIQVDDISAPLTIGPTDTLKVQFHATVGPDGCWAFDSVDRRLTADSLDVLFHGVFEQRTGSSCTPGVVVLEHEEVVPPPVQTPFTITVHQPDGSLLVRLVNAEPGS